MKIIKRYSSIYNSEEYIVMKNGVPVRAFKLKSQARKFINRNTRDLTVGENKS